MFQIGQECSTQHRDWSSDVGRGPELSETASGTENANKLLSDKVENMLLGGSWNTQCDGTSSVLFDRGAESSYTHVHLGQERMRQYGTEKKKRFFLWCSLTC